MSRIAVLGAGSFGTCLAILYARAGHTVTLWVRRPQLAEQLRATRENQAYLPGYGLPAAVEVVSELPAAVAGADYVLGVTPSFAIRETFRQVAPHLAATAVVVNASRGLDESTLQTIEGIYREVLSAAHAQAACYLSGPTFARELAAGLPSAIVLAGRDAEQTAMAQRELSTDTLRIYSESDVAGVLLGGALKNVVAIAVGIADGLQMGSNARAALITRGLAEIARIGQRLGAHPLTFAGLSGLGDLVLTCSGEASRNRRAGLMLGQGKSYAEVTAGPMVAEGIKTTSVASALAEKVGVEAPIIEAVAAILFHEVAPRDAMGQLMTRALKSERA